MQQFTIVRETNHVVMGGMSFEVDCSALPEGVHAVQWDGSKYGEVEYRMTRCEHCSARSKKGNVVFTDPAPYEPYVKAWEAAREAEMKRLAEEQAAFAAAKAAAEAGGADVAGPQG